MSWRMARSLEVLLHQINTLAPKRDKSSDGGVGNAEHSARESDHNPNSKGIVCARDFTNDPPELVSEDLAQALVKSKDPRLKYVISNRKIANGSVDNWAWRPYHGANPHDHHCHVSVHCDVDSEEPWKFELVKSSELTGGSREIEAPPVKRDPVLRKGNGSLAVGELQVLLGVKHDLVFGPETEKAIIAFQKKHDLHPDGVVGPQTWKALRNG